MATTKISCGDNWLAVATKLNISKPDMERIMKLGENPRLTDKKYFSIVSKLVSKRKARIILSWLGAEDFEA